MLIFRLAELCKSVGQVCVQRALEVLESFELPTEDQKTGADLKGWAKYVAVVKVLQLLLPLRCIPRVFPLPHANTHLVS